MKVTKNVHTIRELIETERKSLNVSENHPKRESILRMAKQWYGKNFENTIEESYQTIKKRNRGTARSIHIVCDICETWFDLDEEFVYIDFDENDFDGGFSFSAHRTCIRNLAD